MTTSLFVYGTLMAGEPGHRLLADARFRGAVITRPHYTLRNLGAYPALVADGTTAVAGELYDVDKTTLARLDVYEGVPDLYQRLTIELSDGSLAETYVMPAERVAERAAIETGDWRKRTR